MEGGRRSACPRMQITNMMQFNDMPLLVLTDSDGGAVEEKVVGVIFSFS